APGPHCSRFTLWLSTRLTDERAPAPGHALQAVAQLRLVEIMSAAANRDILDRRQASISMRRDMVKLHPAALRAADALHAPESAPAGSAPAFRLVLAPPAVSPGFKFSANSGKS